MAEEKIFAAVPYAWRQFLAGLVVLVSCLSLFCANAKALLTIDNTGYSNVYGLYASGDLSVNGSEFGYVITTAYDNGAYSLFSDGGNITITGEFGSDGQIEATAGQDYAYGLFGGWGTLTTGAIDGTISADANGSNAFAMYAYSNIDIDGDIGSSANISATATTGSNAYGLYSYIGSIYTGDIDGTITATAENSNAAGLYNSGIASIYTGEINGTITADANTGSNVYGLHCIGQINVDGIGNGSVISATAGLNNAYGLYSSDGSICIAGDMNGTITATAGDEYAYGLYAYGSINTDDIDGTITVTAGDYKAAGLYSDSGSITTGDINGTITATVLGAEDIAAYGLHSGGSLITGAINGTITAEETGSAAYALYAISNINTDDIGSDANITATAGVDSAYGLWSEAGSVTTGDIDGTITVTAGTSWAAGLRNGSGTITTGDIEGMITADANSQAYGFYGNGTIDTNEINGTITATVGGNYAAGLYSNGGYIYTDSINGTISAEATDGSNAYGLRALYIEINGNIGNDANITATAGIDNAYALDAVACHTYIDDIDGTITATAGRDNAYGMYNIYYIETGAINGSITATAGRNNAYSLYVENGSGSGINIDAINGTISAEATTGSGAYALYSNSDITVGDIGSNARITATAGQNYAFGLCSLGSLTTGPIHGTIDANCNGDYACGILSYGSMDVTVDGGTVSAVAHGGTNAAAIQSGEVESPWGTQNANDTVEIVAGSTIVGDIDLAMDGTDDDILTLSGVNTNSTTLDDNINNVENINITGGTWHINGTISDNAITMSGGILSGNGTLGSLNIIGGTLAPGNSIGTITADGDLTFGPTAVFEVDITNGSSDKVIVTGTANLDGTIRVKAIECIDHSFSVVVIDAAGLNGEFSTLEGSSAFLKYSVSYDYVDNNVILNVEPIECDFNCDGKVNFEDLAVIVEQWLGPPGTPSADIAPSGGDGIVNFLDFAKCAENWGL